MANNSFGYIIIDNRACGGYRNPGALVEHDVMGCHHCGAQVIANPDRLRERHFCRQCGGGYICDVCYATSQEPDYVHRSKDELKQLVMSGKAIIVGGDWQRPKLLFL